MISKIYDPEALNLSVIRQEGVEYKCYCINPEHSGSPNSYFNPVTGLIFCHACGFSANVDQIVALTGGEISYLDYVGASFQNDDFSWHNLLNGKLALNNPYLLLRGMNNELIEQYGIIQNKQGIVVPIKNIQGEIVAANIRYSDPKSKIRYQYFGKKTVWPKQNFINYTQDKPVYVTEGIFGTLNAMKHGKQAICIFGSKNIPPEYNIAEFDYVGVFDDDFAGWQAACNILAHSVYCKVHYKGLEADSIGQSEWDKLDDGVNLTNDINLFYDLFDKPTQVKVAKSIRKSLENKKRWR